jgi:DnaJ-class molecular chaperone
MHRAYNNSPAHPKQKKLNHSSSPCTECDGAGFVPVECAVGHPRGVKRCPECKGRGCVRRVARPRVNSFVGVDYKSKAAGE